MTTKDMLRQIGKPQLDCVEAALRFHGKRVGAPEPIVAFIVARAKRAITEGGRSGSYAVRQGEDDIDFIVDCLGRRNVLRFPGERVRG